jgi:hypothetical protein
MSRHEGAFRRKQGYLRDRIADHLGVDESTVRRQFDLISKDGGSLWWQRSF